jgi:UV excision repair protein RAD23
LKLLRIVLIIVALICLHLLKQESQKAELVASTLKLIHSGKILKDDDVISACGIKENDFLVVMVTKAKKPAAPKEDSTAPSTTTSAAAPPAVSTTADAATTAAEAPTPTNAAIEAASTTTPAPTATATVPDAPRPVDTFPNEVVTNLTSMGFPEAEVRHCLRAAHGNPDVAVEFLTNGIPDGVSEAANLVNATTSSTVSSTPSAAASSSTTRPLQALRNHPQFDALRRLVQTNPGALQQVLTQIGQQQPDLLAEINANQATFLEMMNEPILAAAPGAASGTSARSASALGSDADANALMMEELGGGNPAQMAQMIQSMSAEELQQMAQMMGISADQLRDTARMIGQMPPEQLSQFMMQAMAGGGMDGMMGGGAGAGQHVLRLTEEEMAAVDRLTEMGFDRSEAAQAFLACDKNEALAANLLMDSMANGGFFGGDDDNNNGGNNNDADDDDDVDNMYD